MVQKNAKFNSFSADENLAFPFRHEGKKPCHKPCSTGDMQILKIISDTVSKTKTKLLFRCKYCICSWVLLVAKWQLNGSTEKNLSRFHSKSSWYGYLPVLVRLMHHGRLSVAIVGMLWRKHGASASPRLAGISRRPNVWWPKAEQKNNFFGFVLDHKLGPDGRILLAWKTAILLSLTLWH